MNHCIHSRTQSGTGPVRRYRAAFAVLVIVTASLAFAGQTATAATAGRPSPDPTGLKAVGVQGGVRLTWQDNSRNETAWIITNGVVNRYLLVKNGASIGPASFTWNDMGSHQWSCFRVRAYNAYGVSGYDPPKTYVCAFSATSTAPQAPSNVEWTPCYAPNMGIVWEESGSWDSFLIYKSGKLIRTLTAADENGALGVSGPEYFYNEVQGMHNDMLGVSAVKNGVASAIVYIEGGETFTC